MDEFGVEPRLLAALRSMSEGVQMIVLGLVKIYGGYAHLKNRKGLINAEPNVREPDGR